MKFCWLSLIRKKCKLKILESKSGIKLFQHQSKRFILKMIQTSILTQPRPKNYLKKHQIKNQQGTQKKRAAAGSALRDPTQIEMICHLKTILLKKSCQGKAV